MQTSKTKKIIQDDDGLYIESYPTDSDPDMNTIKLLFHKLKAESIDCYLLTFEDYKWDNLGNRKYTSNCPLEFAHGWQNWYDNIIRSCIVFDPKIS